MRSRAAWATWGVVAAGSLCTVACSLALPYGSDRTETVLRTGVAFGLLGIILAVCIGNVPFFRRGFSFRPGRAEWSEFLRGYAFPSVTLFILAMGVFTISIERSDAVEKLRWEFTGKITQKYHSRNHLAPTVVVLDANGDRRVLEGVDPLFWQGASTGDMVLKKKWSPVGTLSGRDARIVPRHWLDTLLGQ
jgi:hypothetical protein